MSKNIVNNHFENEKALSAFVFFTVISCAICLMPELAFAAWSAGTGSASLKAIATTVQTEIQGSGLSIAMNAAGLAAIGYSLFSGFNKGFLVAGGLILAFANLFFPFVNENYKIQ
jgi:hypothetical protein